MATSLFLPQDILDEIIFYTTDLSSLSQCALASRRLLYSSRSSQFTNVRVTSRNRGLVTDVLASPICSIPPSAIRSLSINSIISSQQDKDSLISALSGLSRVRSLELRGLHWSSFSAANRRLLSHHLHTVVDLALHDLIVSSQREVVQFIERFPLLERLSVQRVHLTSLSQTGTTGTSAESDALSVVYGSQSRRLHLERLELSVDDSDALSIVREASTTLRFPQVIFWRSPFDESTKSYTAVQNEILQNIGSTLSDLTFIVSGFNIISFPSNLSHNTHLRKIHPVYVDINLRRLGSLPFNTLLTTLNSMVSDPYSESNSDWQKPPLDEIDLTFHFINWMGDTDCDRLCSSWDWQALDSIVAKLLLSPPSSPLRSLRSTSLPPINSKIVRLNFDIRSEDNTSGAAEERWVPTISSRIKAMMPRCEDEDMLYVGPVDASRYLKN